MSDSAFYRALLILFSFVIVWSAIKPHDYFTWFLEVLPALIGLLILFATYNKYPLSRLAYGILLVHSLILMMGGHYTYAEVPLGYWMKDAFYFSRNHYDRIGHFAQGFSPALVAREVLLRYTPLRPGGMLIFLVVSVCMAVSAAYELIEWGVAVLTGEAAESFLGTQGDVWDTQSDMFMCLIGAVSFLVFFSRVHDRFINQSTK